MFTNTSAAITICLTVAFSLVAAPTKAQVSGTINRDSPIVGCILEFKHSARIECRYTAIRFGEGLWNRILENRNQHEAFNRFAARKPIGSITTNTTITASGREIPAGNYDLFFTADKSAGWLVNLKGTTDDKAKPIVLRMAMKEAQRKILRFKISLDPEEEAGRARITIAFGSKSISVPLEVRSPGKKPRKKNKKPRAASRRTTTKPGAKVKASSATQESWTNKIEKFRVMLKIVPVHKAYMGFSVSFDGAYSISTEPGRSRLGQVPGGRRVKVEKMREPAHAYRITIDGDGDGSLENDKAEILAPGGSCTVTVREKQGNKWHHLEYELRYARRTKGNDAVKESFRWYPLYQAEGTLEIGKRPLRILVRDLWPDGKITSRDFRQGTALGIDFDRDGRFWGTDEFLYGNQIFAHGGKFYYADNKSVSSSPPSLTVRQSTMPLPEVGKNLPVHMTCTALNGTRIALDGPHKRLRVVDFWASWCRPCVKSLPHMQALEKEFSGHVDVYYYSTDARSGVAAAKKVVEDLELPGGRVIIPGTGFDDPVWRMFGSMPQCRRSIPAYVLIGRDGALLFCGRGKDSLTALRSAIRKAGK